MTRLAVFSNCNIGATRLHADLGLETLVEIGLMT
jgi:hypothetical protein